ncbi:extracellular solute-binding protein [Streptomyces acidiscabies]|uniref:Extracellular solute-binding protein n=1 Tax=Streptomyces acidiscabies TaxID=42234 RepID=A0AAP6BLU7_9ACTN|nr:extracellular solute-binding protein [Streptomyces acidiscabies]MBP5935525.1 extracellular solute-binding protein [Streptomyces sp. LBUM 1476]MBZ3916602.1 extracellular solute-binding protein [Streptomyces acidiscabies]MDX2966877.1 extracellular solute-binding protein [Streptomyces acidiscabies]MDX3020280.1 extracellular solute-binding protein [Streptomyces acidiscabies]MDX3791730.1 extracellular solute-binding protein [Streptomyces acidiscabies]
MALSRRTLLGLAAAVPASTALAACGGSSGPGDSNGTATYWHLSGQPQEGVRTGAVERFNKANPKGKIKVTTFANDPYKTRIKTAVGAGKAPTIIWGWGGGTLRSYVKAGQVDDLTPWFAEHPDLKDRLFPNSFGPATVDGKIYAVPSESVEPIVLFYNKKVFADVGVQPPRSWGDIMALVPRFNAKGIAPFALGGQSRWTNMMWLEFLFDRIGGPEVFQAAYDGKKDAWSHPAAIEALTKLQDLVKAGGFIKGFSSITADSNADQALLYTGRAAMMLHGSWSYGIQQTEGKDFVSSGGLGFMNFPPVEGGKGDPSNSVGNPAQYLSLSSKASAEQKEIAKKFFATGVLTDEEVKEWIGTGAVPIRKDSQKLLAGAKGSEFLEFVYGVASNAKSFSQSWDQALSPTAAEALLDNISKLFQLSITPQQFAGNLNKVIGT